MSRSPTLVLAVFLALSARPAHAEPLAPPTDSQFAPADSTATPTYGASAPVHDATLPPVPASRLSAPPRDWRITGYLGGFGNGDGTGVASAVSLLYRTGVVEGGVLAETGSLFFGYNYQGVAATGGFALRPTKNVRFELLGIFGEHFYRDVGGSNGFGDDPGASASMPFAGGRAGAN